MDWLYSTDLKSIPSNHPQSHPLEIEIVSIPNHHDSLIAVFPPKVMRTKIVLAIIIINILVTFFLGPSQDY